MAIRRARSNRSKGPLLGKARSSPRRSPPVTECQIGHGAAVVSSQTRLFGPPGAPIHCVGAVRPTHKALAFYDR